MGNVGSSKHLKNLRVKVKFNFKSSKPGQLTVRKGQMVVILGEPAQGWIKVGIDDKQQGLVPISFLDLSGAATSQDEMSRIAAHAQHHSVPTTLEVRVPRSVKPGQQFKVKCGGQYIYLICPPNVKPGQPVRFRLPHADYVESAGSAADDDAAVPPEPAPLTTPAIEHAECSVCFAPMISKPVCVLNYQGRRTCTHFIHESCGHALLDSGMLGCPVCHSGFDAVVALKSPITDPMGWFDMVDWDGNKKLSKLEVHEVLKATTPVDYRALDAQFNQLWAQWDKKGEGELSFYDVEPLLKFVISNIKVTEQPHAPPVTEKEAFFKFFDEDNSGYLDKDEVYRGMIKAYDLSDNLKAIQHLHESIEVLWVVCDTDGSGFIELDEFVIPGGLADQLKDTAAQLKSE